MCGIYGEINLVGGNVDTAVVRAMGAAIVHRGPDDDGLFIDGEAAIGLRRLSIIDVDGGHQPLFNEDRSVVVCNGEIYNFRELRTDLRERGIRSEPAVTPKSLCTCTKNSVMIAPGTWKACSALPCGISVGVACC